jgi:hypothetical protein
VPLLRGPKNAGEDLLRVGALRRAVAAAAHFPSDDRGTQRWLGPPIRGGKRGIDEKTEDGRQLRRHMPREALGDGQGRGSDTARHVA